jgi:RNA polymerase-binding protein DksA
MTKKSINKSSLTPSEIQKFKESLLEKRNEILHNVLCMEDETLHKAKTDLSNAPFHMADAGSDNFEMENTLCLMDSERKILLEIRNALDRIEQGTYGICEGGGERIPKTRLKAIPWARYCLNCANLSEKGLLVGEDRFKEPDSSDKPDYAQSIEEQNDDFDNITERENNS